MILYIILGGCVLLAIAVLIPLLIQRNSLKRKFKTAGKKGLAENWEKSENMTDVEIDDYRNYGDNTLQKTLDYDADSVRSEAATLEKAELQHEE